MRRQAQANEQQNHLARPTVRLIVGCLLALAFLPAVLFVLAVWSVTAPGGAVFNGSQLGTTGAVFVLSAGLSAVLWFIWFRAPVQKLAGSRRHLHDARLRDALTGLPNRDGLSQILATSFQNRRGSAAVGVLMIHIDRNSTGGEGLIEPVAPDVLRSVGDRVCAVVRASDLVARVDDSCFAVAVPTIASELALVAMARNILRVFEPGYPIGDQEAIITPSIGIAISDEHANTTDILLSQAEAALQTAKDMGGHKFRLYEPNMTDLQHRQGLEARLLRAVQNQQLQIVYQPLVSAQDHRLTGVEALIRWEDPEHGVVNPEDFVPILERSGYINEVGVWVLQTAMTECLRWDDQITGDPLLVSVNVSPRQFSDPRFVEQVIRVIEQTALPASRLQLEITEGLLLEASEQTIGKLKALDQTGLRLALDDFGIGYSSLAYLKQFPLSAIKIDRLFVQGVAQVERDTAIVRAMVDLGHGLGLHVTAEGIETSDQAAALGKLMVDTLQGNLFSLPCQADQIPAIAERLRAAAAVKSEDLAHTWRVVQQLPVEGRTRVLCEDQLLAESDRAIRVIESAGEAARATLLIPESELRIRLQASDPGDGTIDAELRSFDLDLLGPTGQVVQRNIARRFSLGPTRPDSSMSYLTFRAACVTVQEMSI